VQSLRDGCCFGDAVETALATDAVFDLTDTLGLLLRSGAVTGLRQ
jgi:hypothetical protein